MKKRWRIKKKVFACTHYLSKIFKRWQRRQMIEWKINERKVARKTQDNWGVKNVEAKER